MEQEKLLQTQKTPLDVTKPPEPQPDYVPKENENTLEWLARLPRSVKVKFVLPPKK